MTERAYAAHERLVAPARPRADLWRLLAGLMVVIAVTFAMNAMVQTAVAAMAPPDWLAGLPAGRSPSQMILLLGGFVFLTLGVAVAARVIHQRGLPGIIGPPRATLHQFWRVFRGLLMLGAVLAVLPPYDMGPPLTPNLPPGLWLALLPVSLTVVLIQTSAEEILFRGYLQQTLAARFARPAVWLVIPSVVFALGHYIPAQAGPNAPFVALWAGLFGLMMADLTARSGTLGPAIAVHFFNNIIALLIFGASEGLSGLALFTLPFDMSDTGIMREWLIVDFAMMLVTWLVARLAIRR